MASGQWLVVAHLSAEGRRRRPPPHRRRPATNNQPPTTNPQNHRKTACPKPVHLVPTPGRRCHPANAPGLSKNRTGGFAACAGSSSRRSDKSGSASAPSAALQNAGYAVKLVVEIGRVTDCPARRNTAASAEKQLAAEKIIFDDPYVQAMMRDFGAKIVPGSIKPI